MAYVGALTPEQITLGEQLTVALVQHNFPLSLSAWWYLTDADEWRLLLASSTVDTHGPTYAYVQIVRIMEKEKISVLPLRKISAIRTKDRIVGYLRQAFKTTAISGVRITKTTIGDMYVDDAYLYLVR